MNYTQIYKKMIAEAKETFAKYIPDSEELLKSIKIVVCSSDSVKKEVMKFCKKINTQYRDIDLTDQIILGKTINGEGEYGIVLNEEADDDDGTMYMTMWHEIAHCYAWEKDGVTCSIMDFPMPFGNDFEKKLRDRWSQTMGYDFWKEFVAENIAYYLMQMTGKYEDYIKVIDSLDTMLETCLNEIDTSITADRDQHQYLYKFFSLLFAERRAEMMKEKIDLSMVNDPEIEYHLKGDIIMQGNYARGKIPFGFKRKDEDPHLIEISPDDAAIIRRIFTEISEDRESCYTLAKKMKEEKLLGRMWSELGLKVMIQNRLYYGCLQTKDFTHEGIPAHCRRHPGAP